MNIRANPRTGVGEAAVSAEGLVKRYPPDVTALDGVSLAVRAGTIFGLLGPNGAGKSTTRGRFVHTSAPSEPIHINPILQKGVAPL